MMLIDTKTNQRILWVDPQDATYHEGCYSTDLHGGHAQFEFTSAHEIRQLKNGDYVCLACHKTMRAVEHVVHDETHHFI